MPCDAILSPVDGPDMEPIFNNTNSAYNNRRTEAVSFIRFHDLYAALALNELRFLRVWRVPEIYLTNMGTRYCSRESYRRVLEAQNIGCGYGLPPETGMWCAKLNAKRAS